MFIPKYDNNFYSVSFPFIWLEKHKLSFLKNRVFLFLLLSDG